MYKRQVGIIGATGSGKSTLITHMNGLNKPTSGKIYIDGRDLWADPEKIRDFRFLTGLVFQYPEYQLFEETCYKDIALDVYKRQVRTHSTGILRGLPLSTRTLEQSLVCYTLSEVYRLPVRTYATITPKRAI